MFVSKESTVSPRSRVIAASDQNDFFHLLDESKLFGESEPATDMLHYPRAKISPHKGIFASSLQWEG